MSENPIFSYTKRDYESSRQEGLARIPILSQGQWTDLNATDPGIIILDYVHALVDMMQYYLDHQALESFITTAKERVNIFRLAKQMSYDIRSAKGATCDVWFEITASESYNRTIKIPKYTAISTLSGIQYLTTQDAYLPAGAIRVLVTCSQGVLHEYKYQGTGISRFSNVVGAKNQVIRLVDNNIDTSSIVVRERDKDGRLWSTIDHISFASTNERVYEVELNPDDSVSIKFGDGERGAVPTTEDNFYITYVTTAAEEGRVAENTLVSLLDSIYDNGYYIDFKINNNNPSSGGSSSQSTQEIRDLAPGMIKAQDRAVTLSDFENLAKSVDGVLEAKAYDLNNAPDLCLPHEVKVIITPKDIRGDIEVLKNKVYNFLSQRMIPPTNLQLLSPSYIDIAINIEVRRTPNTTESRLKYAVEQAIIGFFDEIGSKVGEPFYPTELLATISRVEGLRSILQTTISTPDGIIPLDKPYYISGESSIRLSLDNINKTDDYDYDKLHVRVSL